MPLEHVIREEEMSQIFEDIEEDRSDRLPAVSSLRSTACLDTGEQQVGESDATSLVSEDSDLTELSEEGSSVSDPSMNQTTETDGTSPAPQDDIDDTESEHETGNIGRYWTRKKDAIVSQVERNPPGPEQQSVPERSSEPASAPVPKAHPTPVPERAKSVPCVLDISEPPAIQIACDALFEGFCLPFSSCEDLLNRDKLELPQFDEGINQDQLEAMEELRSRALVLRDESITRWAKQQGLTRGCQPGATAKLQTKPWTSCVISREYSKTSQGRRRHLLTHYPEGAFCPVCMRIFARECSFDRHLTANNDSCLDKPDADRFLLRRAPTGRLSRGLSRKVFNMYYLGVMEDFPMPDEHFKIVSGGRDRHVAVRL